jgi:hypothetical protein
MGLYQQKYHGWIEKWQQYEPTAYPLILGLLGTISTIYLQKIEWLLWNSQWMVASASISSGILLLACWISKQLPVYYPEKIKGIRFWVHEDVLSALRPYFSELKRRENVTHEDILNAIPEEYRAYVFMPFRWISPLARRLFRR